jgi:hypothetical protein
MAITKEVVLDSVELLTSDRVRVKFHSVFHEGTTENVGEVNWATLDPSNPSHQPAINACRSAYNAVAAFIT